MTGDWRSDSWKIHEFNLSLLENRIFSDVEFLVGCQTKDHPGIYIRAHKFILSVRSSVFETMFGTNWSTIENSTKEAIKIPDAEPDVFMSFLKYLYADCFVSTVEEANDLLYLGHKYNVTSLIARCTDFLMSKLMTSNVIGIYRTAILFDQKELKATALTYLLGRAEKVFKEDEILSIEIDLLSEIIQKDDLCISETDLFLAILRWSVAELQRRGFPQNSRNTRKLLQEKILPHLRFLQMTPEDFSMQVASCGILTSEEIILIFQHINVKTPSLKSCLPKLSFSTKRRQFDPNNSDRNSSNFPDRRNAGLYLSSAICCKNNHVANTFFGRYGRVYTESLEFSTDRDIYILGIGLYGPGHKRYENGEIRAPLATYEVEAAMYEIKSDTDGKISRSTAAHVQRVITTRNDFEISFIVPKKIVAKNIYHMRVAFKGEETQHGVSRLSTAKVATLGDEVVFSFMRGFRENTLLGVNESPGRIRTIVFCTNLEEGQDADVNWSSSE